MDLAAGLKALDTVTKLNETLSQDQGQLLDTLPSTLAALVKSKATDQESVAEAVSILEGPGTFQEKVMKMLASNRWQSVLNTFVPAEGKGVYDPHAQEPVLVPLLEVLRRGGRCLECGAVQSVGALVGMDAETGLPTPHLYNK